MPTAAVYGTCKPITNILPTHHVKINDRTTVKCTLSSNLINKPAYLGLVISDRLFVAVDVVFYSVHKQI